ncbi:hypothetical protein SpCBS45565_g06512 [Spizellomyces sp. 'palustris']|nr:hypothetical protein SpCBS45565_g06512 [Spizellomyces sp. 'palustris']
MLLSFTNRSLGNCYGTSFEAVELVQSTGRICILDLEINGVRSIKSSPMHAKYIFVQPPSIEVLEQRLRSRNTETEETLQKRLATAKDAMDFAETGAYEKIIVNDDLDKAFAELDDFISVLTKPSLTTDAVAPTEAVSTKPEPVDNAVVSPTETTVTPVAQKDTPSKKSKVCTII